MTALLKPGAPLRVGTRASALAVAQTSAIATQLGAYELVTITSEGDRSSAPLASMGGTGVFVSALRDALLRGDVDVAVHSLKDLPTTPAEGITLAAVPTREDARDVVVARDGLTLGELPEGSRVGTIALFPESPVQLYGLALLAVVVGVLFWVLLNRTRFGFDLRATGASESAAVASGVDTRRMIVVTMLVSGAVAGLIGLPVMFSQSFNYGSSFQTGLGFTGIAVALLGRNHPVGIAFGALVFAYLSQQANAREVTLADLPITPVQVARVAALVADRTLTNANARKVVDGVLAGEGDPDAVVEARGLAVVQDDSALEAAVTEALAANPSVAEKIRGGKVAAAGAIVGAVLITV